MTTYRISVVAEGETFDAPDVVTAARNWALRAQRQGGGSFATTMLLITDPNGWRHRLRVEPRGAEIWVLRMAS